MSTIAFDTLKFANTLKKSGVPSEQAEAQAEAFAEIFQVNLEKLSSKNDVARLDEKIESLRKELNQRLTLYLTAMNAQLPRPNPNYDPSKPTETQRGGGRKGKP